MGIQAIARYEHLKVESMALTVLQLSVLLLERFDPLANIL
jgi:hypothetical protein